MILVRLSSTSIASSIFQKVRAIADDYLRRPPPPREPILEARRELLALAPLPPREESLKAPDREPPDPADTLRSPTRSPPPPPRPPLSPRLPCWRPPPRS